MIGICNSVNGMVGINGIPYCRGTYDNMSYEFALAYYVMGNDFENVQKIIDEDLTKISKEAPASTGGGRMSRERNIALLPKLIEISTGNEYHEMTAFLLDYQYEHNLFQKKELELL